MFTAASSCPEQAWRRLASESSAWVLLANANDADSLRSTHADLEFVRGLGKVPFVVATYMSMTGEEMTAKQVAKALGLDAKTPVLPCHLRDRESVASVVRAALELAAANAAPEAPARAAAPQTRRPSRRRPTSSPACLPRPAARRLDTRARRKDTTACTTPATA